MEACFWLQSDCGMRPCQVCAVWGWRTIWGGEVWEVLREGQLAGGSRVARGSLLPQILQILGRLAPSYIWHEARG